MQIFIPTGMTWAQAGKVLPRCLWYSKHYKPLSHIALGYFMAKKGKEKKKKEEKKEGKEEQKK